MKKLNPVMYHKLLLQAEEAKELGMTKLASSILEAIGPYPEENPETYSYAQLQDDMHRGLWKLASQLMVYYDVQSADAEALNKVIVSWASKMTDDLEQTLNISDVKGPLEPPLPGEEE